MPHAEDPVNQAQQTMTNGHKNQSQFINHISSYPVVSDSIEGFKTNPYGAKSLEVADATYSRFGKPLEPYLQGPYSYAKPYVEKVDSMADRSLERVDAHFPIMKEETNTVVDKAVNLALLPLTLTGRTYNYLMTTWSDEYEKTANHNNRGPGLTTSAMALISTELKVASDCLQTAANFVGRKSPEAKHLGQDMANEARNMKSQASQRAQQGQEQAKQMSSQAKNMVRDASDNVRSTARDTANDARNTANNAANDARNTANNTARQAQAKAN